MKQTKYSNLIAKHRPQPLQQEPTPPATELEADGVFDLSKHLGSKPQGGAAPTAPTFETEEAKTEQDPAVPTAPDSPEFSEVETKFASAIADPELLASGLTDLADILRQFAYPTIYEKIMFKGQEKQAAQYVLSKAATGTKPAPQEMPLLSKIQQYQQHIEKISWDATEKAQVKKYLIEPYVKKLEGTEAIVKYFPFLILASIEGKRFKAVAGSSAPVFIEHTEQQPQRPQRPAEKPTTNVEEDEAVKLDLDKANATLFSKNEE